MAGRVGQVTSDFIISFMWVWLGAMIKLFVYNFMGLGSQPRGEIIKRCILILSMFVFAWFSKIRKGGSYNPLTSLSSAISGSFSGFIFTVCIRIPAQVLGSITGAKLILQTFPKVGNGPRLNVNLHHGALTEGLLTFVIISISLGLAKNNPNSFFMKTWISTISKFVFHILGSDLTAVEDDSPLVNNEVEKTKKKKKCKLPEITSTAEDIKKGKMSTSKGMIDALKSIVSAVDGMKNMRSNSEKKPNAIKVLDAISGLLEGDYLKACNLLGD
ncbi:hypothetical protein GIB67_007871 [Kingdonia uniflora]|uniref:Uncharacterized protein n=1 Tax=Kingdonia uniflora TaxID=39325 RepID=A0A7J7PBD7_9MAGN|nr:hypothetical protein GIB67_007871 [Kingdonia uniflora]